MTTIPRPTADTLAAALPREMVRVTGIIAEYRLVEMGFIAAAMMEASVAWAQKAIDDGDVVEMLRAYADLKGYE